MTLIYKKTFYSSLDTNNLQNLQIILFVQNSD